MESSSDEVIGKSSDVKKRCTKRSNFGQTLDVMSIILLCQQCQSNIYRHQLTTRHLSFKQFWFFTLPQAVLIMASGIGSFFAATELVKGADEARVSIVTGSMAVIVVFVKTLESHFDFNVRAAMHCNTVCDLRDLRDNLEILRIKLTLTSAFKRSGDYDEDDGIDRDGNGNEDKDEDEHGGGENNGESFDSIQSRYRQCLQACKSTIPLAIEESFRMIDSQLELAKTIQADQHFKAIGIDDWLIKVWFSSYDWLTAEITSHPFWPLRIPDSALSVRNTMIQVKKIVKNGKDFWNEEVEYDYEFGEFRKSTDMHM